MVLWLPQFYGELELASRFSPVDWHIHELYFGFLAAVITGFLFTAVPNWTGRMPIDGKPLLVLVLIWVAGRIAITFSAAIPWQLAMGIDLAFLIAITFVIGNEICAGKNWRNLKVLVPLVALLAANTLFHLEAQFEGESNFSRRLALAAAITLIMLIGGRIVPSFTRNWLVKHNPGHLPAPFSRFDMIAIAVAVIALGFWIFLPDAASSLVALTLAALLHLIRLYRWAGIRTWREPLVLILHIAYAFIPLGFALLAASMWSENIPEIAGIHALSTGAIGTMTLSVMLRATLGHSGHTLTAGPVAKIIFASVITASLARIAEGLGFGSTNVLLHIAAFGWSIAFAGFGIIFAPMFFAKKL